MVITLIIMCAPRARAQEDYRFDMGGGVGMTGYLGDANASNPWRHPGVDGEILFRYMANPRWAFKTGFYAAQLRGETTGLQNVMPSGANYSFSTTMFELGELAEFNFFNYGIGESYRKLRRFTPYIAAGLGFNVWSADSKTGFAVNIPLGLGVKFKVKKRLNLGLEFLMKKVFSDRVDGAALDDPYRIESSFLKNTDWYSTLTLTLSYEFGKRCEVCHYKE